MLFHLIKPRQSLNKAFLKVKPTRPEIEVFKTNLIQLIDQTNDTESEEHHKNLVADFLKKTYYDPDHYINTKERNDLVIHNGKDRNTSVGVIIEAKKPTNMAEMLRKDNLNVKALHELVLYYLRERITGKNLEIKYLIGTNIHEWFIFDAQVFEKAFAQSKSLVKQYEEFVAGHLSGTTTDFFYKEIAAPFINQLDSTIEFAHFDLRDYDKPLRNNDKKDDIKLIALFKLLSPQHLLKLPFANDSNSLDRKFYSELLHIIGLTETKQGGKKVIERNKPGERNSGSLLENAIIQLDSLDKIGRMEKPSLYGATAEERLFNVGLELSITWVNRILFLKLLEAQLIAYRKGDSSFSFLNYNKIRNYDDLNSLFFQVLAKKHHERSEDVQQDFDKVPYLNSSLFEPNDMEHDTIFISNLRDEKKLPILSSTVLKDQNGKKRTGELTALQYFFEFLEAYDFSSEGAEDIQEDNKTLINASVLGLIFEKINGYKDGSFFTPGFITMYMCRETIRRAVVQKFNDAKSWVCKDYQELKEDLQDYIKAHDRKEARKEANDIINSLKICDPAVGSGHFLVSALNEIISIKSDLKILVDRNGERISDYDLEVDNDELVITDIDENRLFEYHPDNKNSQRLQEALFHEKQTIIENCLFGVDINPNSVKICRLRLWIELLKNAYYKNETELETLPNIDINIKCGNSLISRFGLDADIKEALKKSKWSIDSYRLAVDSYRNAQSKEEKHEMQRLISDIKSDFRSEISRNDPKLKKLSKIHGELVKLTTQTSLFDQSAKEKKDWNKKVEKLTKDSQKLETEIEEIKNNKIYENAFEWRFEFPEVLNDDGDFVGFDVVIGNPPYIRQEEIKVFKSYLQNHYSTFAGTADLFVYFIELGMNMLKDDGNFIFIVPNKWMRAGYGKALRIHVKGFKINFILDFGDLPVFEEATTYPCILSLSKQQSSETFLAANIDTLQFQHGLESYINQNRLEVITSELSETGWTLSDAVVQKLLAKLKQKGKPLGEYVDGKIFRGVLTGLNEAFVIDEAIKEKLIAEDPKSAEIIKPFLAGRDIKRYQQPKSDKYLILFKSGATKTWFGDLSEEEAWFKLCEKFPSICQFLKHFETKAKARYDKGNYWWELRACDYYEEFEKEKIIIPAIVKSASYGYDVNGNYSNDKTSIIPSSDFYLLGVIDSKLIDFFMKQIASTKQNGYFEYKPVYVSQLPISEKRNKEIESRVAQILDLKKADPKADTLALEAEIDQLVYALYGLTEEEIKIVEGD